MRLICKHIYSQLFFMVLWGASCTSNPTTKEIVGEIIEKKTELRHFATTTTRNLRLRNTPDLQGEIVEIVMAENSLMEYLQDSTTFETQVGTGNTAMVGRWYKLKSENGNEGWAFGPLLAFKTLAENKAITAQKKAEDLQMQKDSASGKVAAAVVARKKGSDIPNMPIVEAYNQYLKGLSDKNIYSVTAAADELQRVCENSTMATADLAFISFRGLLRRVETQVKKTFNAQKYAHLKKELVEYGRVYPNSDSLLWRLEQNGFRLAIVEGNMGLIIDVDFLARQFYRLVSPEMRAYLNQKQLESETNWIENKKLLVSARKIAEWTVFWSNFADKNTKFVLAPEAQQNAGEYLQILIYGLQNTPAFDKNNKLMPEFKEAYEHIISISADSQIGERIVAYYQTLQEAGFSKNGYVEQAQLAFFNQ